LSSAVSRGRHGSAQNLSASQHKLLFDQAAPRARCVRRMTLQLQGFGGIATALGPRASQRMKTFVGASAIALC